VSPENQLTSEVTPTKAALRTQGVWVFMIETTMERATHRNSAALQKAPLQQFSWDTIREQGKSHPKGLQGTILESTQAEWSPHNSWAL
jgi:hypothetical protein